MDPNTFHFPCTIHKVMGTKVYNPGIDPPMSHLPWSSGTCRWMRPTWCLPANKLQPARGQMYILFDLWNDTVDDWNPVNSPIEVGCLSQYLWICYIPGGAGFQPSTGADPQNQLKFLGGDSCWGAEPRMHVDNPPRDVDKMILYIVDCHFFQNVPTLWLWPLGMH